MNPSFSRSWRLYAYGEMSSVNDSDQTVGVRLEDQAPSHPSTTLVTVSRSVKSLSLIDVV